MERMRDWYKKRRFTGVSRTNVPLALVAIAVICILIIIIALIMTMKKSAHKIIPNAEPDRIECPGFSEKNCTKFDCYYKPAAVGPACYMKRDSFGYEVQSVKVLDDGIEVMLKNLTYRTPYGLSLPNVTFKLTYLTENILRFQYKDAQSQRYEVPVQHHFPLLKKPPGFKKSELTYDIKHANATEVFHFAVTRKNGINIWDSRIGALVLTDRYLQTGSYLPSSNVYGLGEHVHDSLKHNMVFRSWPMFSKDAPPNANVNEENLYGVHPFYTCLEDDGKSHGVLFLNSNAMEGTFLPAPAVTFRTVGGILDFFIFVGDNPEHVIQLYTSLIGRPMIPPYWALGFHLSRYGYNRIADLQNVHNRNLKKKIPIAVQYLDIDHMDQRKSFTYDQSSFPGLPEYIVKQKKEHGLKWVIILNPATASAKDYEPYSSGLEKNVFIQRNSDWESSMFPGDLDKRYVYGKVWPSEYSAFPDYFQNSTKEWWKELIKKHKETLDFDALWIDMNEPANFGTNEARPDYCMGDLKEMDCWSLMCPESRSDYPPYNPLLRTGSSRLSTKTLCMDSVQSNTSHTFLHYDVHSLYGWSQTQPTLEAVQSATNSRSFVISRSTYPSSGRYAGHWLGDNHSSFEDMKKSIIGMLEFNLFGIPFVGADVCGFFGDTSPQLCKRWMQLGAFYPYFRNHNVEGRMDQDPAALTEELAEYSRKAIERRISLNPYLYTLFYKAHKYGNTVVRPVFHEFPTDGLTWTLDTQFMWGEALMISPILEEIPNSLSIYLPDADWWRFDLEKSWKEPFTERFIIATDADEYTPIHVRGGSILPYDKYVPFEPDRNSTRNITLYVFPLDGKASGDMFTDDGDSADTIENDAYALYEFSFVNCSLTISSHEKSKFAGPTPNLEKIVLFDVIDVTSVSDERVFSSDNSTHTIITVGDEISKVEKITWKTSDGKCP